MTDRISHGGAGTAAPMRLEPSIGTVMVNGWHAHPGCVGERFCRCGLCHLATECDQPDHCVARVAIDRVA